MTLVVRLDSGGVVGVGLPACRTSTTCPHQAGGDLIVVVPKVPHLSCGSTDAIEVPLRVSPSLGFTACVTYVCCGAHTPEASNPGLLRRPGFILSEGWDERRERSLETDRLSHARESSTSAKGFA